VNYVAAEIMDAMNDIAHYGIKRRSGRYPWGSGENPYQHSEDFLARVEKLQKEGKSLSEIADELDIVNFNGEPSVTRLNDQIAIAKNQRRILEVARAKSLREDGLTLQQIADKMGYKNDSSIRSLLDPNAEARMKIVSEVADKLKKECDEKGMIDVGTGTEVYLNISKEKMRQSLELLKAQGYEVYGGGLPQATNPGKQTNLRVLCPPGSESKDIYDYKNIHFIDDVIMHEGDTKFSKAFEYPASMDSSRLMIRYRDEGGNDKDGVIELRRGVPDLSLGESNYAQVRILVDGTRYLKGMAVYSDDMPDGVDVIFNTNKDSSYSKLEVLKPIGKDPENPFGALVKEHGGQYYYEDPSGEKRLGLINKTREEGDWMEWKDRLPSQFLSKQPKQLVEKQLKKTMDDRDDEFATIMELDNPIVKKAFLEDFARSCDYQAEHLYAASLPAQKYHVILPLTSISDNEIYAPGYENGQTVYLVRFPHQNTGEIPTLKVNNRVKEGSKVIGDKSIDAVGISKAVADRLSGADFDGDTVMVIPASPGLKIKTSDPLPGLENFDPKLEYAKTPGMTFMKYTKNGKEYDRTQIEMGMISNLITDMTLLGASEEDLAKATKHAQVVIDAAKHELDYKRSEYDNDIARLKEKYQGGGGAATIVSKAKSPVYVNKRQGIPKIDNETGELIYKEAEGYKLHYTDRATGKEKTRTEKISSMENTKDAFSLVSEARNPKEILYAEFANYLKSMANRARKESVTTPGLQYSRTAALQYKDQVESLDRKLSEAKKNAPLERRAQIITRTEVDRRISKNPTLSEDKSALKKVKQQTLVDSRNKTGASRYDFEISDKEWEAIQAGAITSTKLSQIMNYADTDRLRELATPKSSGTLSVAKQNRIKALDRNGYTINQIAKAVDASTATVSKYLKGD